MSDHHNHNHTTDATEVDSVENQHTTSNETTSDNVNSSTHADSTSTGMTTADSQDLENSATDASHDSVSTNSTTATASSGVTVESDGYAHQTADAEHHDVQGLETNQNEIQGSVGDDVISGGVYNDVLEGGSGSDSLDAGAGDDILVGGGSSDTGVNHLDGGAGDDILIAAGHKTSQLDALFSANSLLNAVVHNDAKFADVANILDGTLATAAAQVENDFAIHSGNGNDLILNFHTATDKIVIDHNLNGSGILDSASVLEHMTVNGSNVSIDLGHGNSITLVGVDASSLSASDFVII